MTKESGPKVDLRCGDCLNVLPTLESGSVNCCVTSPPYWGLRDYGTAGWEGGSEDCDHIDTSRSISSTYKTTAEHRTEKASALFGKQFRDTCGKCGAKRVDHQLGLEKTPEEYVAKMVQVFREVRRVLRDDGTLWLNLGDSYTAGAVNRNGMNASTLAGGKEYGRGCMSTKSMGGFTTGLKPKDLVGIPWRVAFALQADGWYLRQDIIWHKPNPMPESVTDRCTKAHEYIFLLAKSQRYYYDAEAVKEQATSKPHAPGWTKTGDASGRRDRTDGNEAITREWGSDGKRNRRSVWTITPKPFKGAHFAVFPPDLAEPCILAGCPAGGTVLDPFNGSGTCGMVAVKNGRNYVGIELNPEYAEMSRARIGHALRTTSEELFIGGGQ